MISFNMKEPTWLDEVTHPYPAVTLTTTWSGATNPSSGLFWSRAIEERTSFKIDVIDHFSSGLDAISGGRDKHGEYTQDWVEEREVERSSRKYVFMTNYKGRRNYRMTLAALICSVSCDPSLLDFASDSILSNDGIMIMMCHMNALCYKYKKGQISRAFACDAIATDCELSFMDEYGNNLIENEPYRSISQSRADAWLKRIRDDSSAMGALPYNVWSSDYFVSSLLPEEYNKLKEEIKSRFGDLVWSLLPVRSNQGFANLPSNPISPITDSSFSTWATGNNIRLMCTEAVNSRILDWPRPYLVDTITYTEGDKKGVSAIYPILSYGKDCINARGNSAVTNRDHNPEMRTNQDLRESENRIINLLQFDTVRPTRFEALFLVDMEKHRLALSALDWLLLMTRLTPSPQDINQNWIGSIAQMVPSRLWYNPRLLYTSPSPRD